MAFDLTPLQKEVIAGLATGSITTLVVHPLDLVKIRLQLLATNANNLGYSYVIGSILKGGQGKSLQIVKEAYRGLGINWFGNATAWALYFGLYRVSKDLAYRLYTPGAEAGQDELRKDAKLTPLMYLSSGAISGVLTSILTNPIWVIKTRIMSTNSREKSSYKSTLDGIQKLLREEGARGLWRGLIPSLFGVSQGAIYFMMYDTLKHRFSSLRHYEGKVNQDKNLKITETFVISSISKVVSVTAVYPFQLLKSNLQSFEAQRKQYTFSKLIRSIFEAEGTMGFYKGLSANLLRAIPSTCITFCIYENLKNCI